MVRPVSLTLDFEDLRTSPDQPERVGLVTRRLLERWAELGIRGTMFCVASTARDHPELIASMARDGHEIGVHGLHHTPNDLLTAEEFAQQTAEAKAILEDLSGVAVTLYRAPQYSLVPETPWIPSILTDLGFVASSSVLPAPSPLYGWPGAPTTTFRWPSGLIELPAPLLRLGPLTIPFLGGTYLRLLPARLRRRGRARASADTVLWAYCHPWEFDPDEPFYVFEDGGWLASRVGWMNRKGMLGRVERVLSPEPGLPLGEIIPTLGELPVFDPSIAEGASGSRLEGLLRTRSRAR
mgnify:CR=1 FL=1